MLNAKTAQKPAKPLQYVLTYTVLWSLCTAVIWAVFQANGKSFLWITDGVPQHFISFNYLCEYLEDLILRHQFRGFFNYSIGQGMDIVQTLGCYDFTDPVSALAALVFPLGRLQRYTLMIFLKLYLTGLSFMLFCFSTERRNLPAVLAGALAYTFSGAVLFTVARHPNYVNWAYCFPLILSGAEGYARRGKRAPLVLFVALNVVTSYYTFYINTILTGIYLLTGCLCRALRQKTAAAFRQEFGLLLRTVLVSAVGVALSAVILLPSIYAFLNNYRVGFASGYTESLLHYEWKYYFKLPESLFAMNYTAGYHNELGLNAAVFFPVVLLFLRKGERTELKAMLVITLLMLCLPLAGRVMNGFGYASNRWSYALPFYASVALTELFVALPDMTWKEKALCLAAFAAYFAICAVTFMRHSDPVTKRLLLPMLGILLGVTAMVWVLLQTGRAGRQAGSLLLGAVLVSAMLQTYAMFSPAAGGYVNEYLDRAEAASVYQDYSSVAVKGISGGFFRTEEEDQEIINRENYDGYHNINGTSFYWSMYPASIFEYYRDLGLSSVSQNCRPAGLSGRTGLLELAGVKYYTKPASSSGTVPYGYREILSADPAFQVYENPYALPVAYTCSAYLTEDEYAALDGIEKEQALLQAVVLPQAPDAAGISHVTPMQNAQILDCEITETDGVRLDGSMLSADREGKITLTVKDVPENCELYLYLRGIHLKTIRDATLSVDGDYRVKIDVSRKADHTSVTKSTWISNRDYKWSVLRDDVAFNLGCGFSGENTIRLKFGKDADFTVGSIEVIAVPMSAYTGYAQALREHVLEDVEVGADRVSGTIAVPEARILQFSVPYSSGWTAYLDGEKTELLRSDIMYMSVIVPEGEHSAELRYRTPGMKAGLVISAVTLILWLGCEFTASRRKRKVA